MKNRTKKHVNRFSQRAVALAIKTVLSFLPKGTVLHYLRRIHEVTESKHLSEIDNPLLTWCFDNLLNLDDDIRDNLYLNVPRRLRFDDDILLVIINNIKSEDCAVAMYAKICDSMIIPWCSIFPKIRMSKAMDIYTDNDKRFDIDDEKNKKIVLSSISQTLYDISVFDYYETLEKELKDDYWIIHDCIKVKIDNEQITATELYRCLDEELKQNENIVGHLINASTQSTVVELYRELPDYIKTIDWVIFSSFQKSSAAHLGELYQEIPLGKVCDVIFLEKLICKLKQEEKMVALYAALNKELKNNNAILDLFFNNISTKGFDIYSHLGSSLKTDASIVQRCIDITDMKQITSLYRSLDRCLKHEEYLIWRCSRKLEGYPEVLDFFSALDDEIKLDKYLLINALLASHHHRYVAEIYKQVDDGHLTSDTDVIKAMIRSSYGLIYADLKEEFKSDIAIALSCIDEALDTVEVYLLIKKELKSNREIVLKCVEKMFSLWFSKLYKELPLEFRADRVIVGKIIERADDLNELYTELESVLKNDYEVVKNMFHRIETSEKDPCVQLRTLEELHGNLTSEMRKNVNIINFVAERKSRLEEQIYLEELYNTRSMRGWGH